MVFVRYFVTLANGTDAPVTVDQIEMEGSFLTRRASSPYSILIAPHGQTTLTFAANGYTEAQATHPVTREPTSVHELPPLRSGPPSMLVVVHYTDARGSQRETFEQAIAGR